MANRGVNTNRSQFFILYDGQPHLDNKHTVFGQLIDGFECLEAMERTRVNEKNRPLLDMVVDDVTIHSNPIADMV